MWCSCCGDSNTDRTHAGGWAAPLNLLRIGGLAMACRSSCVGEVGGTGLPHRADEIL